MIRPISRQSSPNCAHTLRAASGAIDGSKLKAVNNQDRNFTRVKVERRRVQLEESVSRYRSQFDARTAA